MKTEKYLQPIIIFNVLALLTINVKSAQANPLKCYQQALPTFANSHTDYLVTWMCQGATNTIPAHCFRAALPTFYHSSIEYPIYVLIGGDECCLKRPVKT